MDIHESQFIYQSERFWYQLNDLLKTPGTHTSCRDLERGDLNYENTAIAQKKNKECRSLDTVKTHTA